MNAETIAKLKELEAKATQGPWNNGEFSVFTGCGCAGSKTIFEGEPNDIKFVCELRNHARELLEGAEKGGKITVGNFTIQSYEPGGFWFSRNSGEFEGEGCQVSGKCLEAALEKAFEVLM